jgi:hypothetical protein
VKHPPHSQVDFTFLHLHLIKLKKILSQVNNSLHNIDLIVAKGLWISIVICCTFWSFCLFDTLGDVIGAIHAFWIVIIMVFIPYIFLAGKLCFRKCLLSSIFPSIHRQSHQQTQKMNLLDYDQEVIEVQPRDSVLEMSDVGINPLAAEVSL